MSQRTLYIGNRRKGPSSWAKPEAADFGITIARIDTATGRMETMAQVAPELSIGAMHLDARRGVLYAVDEAMTLPGYPLGGGGQVVAFRIGQDGGLTELSRSPSFGSLPSYLAQDLSGDHLLVAHHTGHTPVTRTRRNATGHFEIALDYDEASCVAFPLDAEGVIGSPAEIWTTEGRGAAPGQTHPQLHCIARAPGRDLFAVCDKGADRLHLLDWRDGTLTGTSRSAPPSSCPRYAVFHPHLPVLYVNHETAPVIEVLGLEPEGLVLEESHNPLPDGTGSLPGPQQSDLFLHPSGRWLYTLIRGREAVSTFGVGPEGGLTFLGMRPLGVTNARGGLISPDGTLLLVAAVVSREVLVLRVGKDGLPADELFRLPLPHPGSIVFGGPVT